MDNASSNDVAIEYLRRKTKDRVGSLLGCEFLHMRCCAHILNLIVQDGLKDLNESFVKIRNVVRYVKSSPNRFEKFKACVEKEKIQSKSLLCLDVSTRWNSTYLMLESALKFVAAFERMEEDDGHFLRYFEDPSSGPPRFLDWENVRLFTKFLGMFYEATLRFSGSLFVTTNMYFHELISLQDQLNQLCNGRGDPLLKGMAQRMKLKYDKYWGSVDRINPMLFVAVVVDPRYKLKYVRFWFKQWYDKEKADELGLRVREVLNRLYKHNSGAMGTPCGASASGTCEFDSGDVAVMSSMLSGFGSAEERMKRYNNIYKQHLVDEDSVECKSELERYLLEASVDPDTEGFDILDWWRVNSSRYRILSQVARDVLAIPVSTVASESAFSTGGRVLDPFRSSLSPNTVEALICTQNWLRSKDSTEPINLREAMDEVENYELESGNVFIFFSNLFLLLLFINSLVFMLFIYL